MHDMDCKSQGKRDSKVSKSINESLILPHATNHPLIGSYVGQLVPN